MMSKSSKAQEPPAETGQRQNITSAHISQMMPERPIIRKSTSNQKIRKMFDLKLNIKKQGSVQKKNMFENDEMKYFGSHYKSFDNHRLRSNQSSRQHSQQRVIYQTMNGNQGQASNASSARSRQVHLPPQTEQRNRIRHQKSYSDFVQNLNEKQTRKVVNISFQSQSRSKIPQVYRSGGSTGHFETFDGQP